MTSTRETDIPRPRVHVALLRGINVGGKNKLPMKDLRGLFEELGCTDVVTYIQSGNVVYAAPAALAKRIPEAAAEAIAGEFGLAVPVVTRSAAELHRVAERNPFLDSGADPATLHVAFLAGKPAARRMAALDPGRSPPDEYLVQGSEIYLRCPNGVARSKLTNAYFDTALATTSTARNWRTVLKLVELTSA